MSSNYTPLDIEAVEKRYANRRKSIALFIIIAILSLIVSALLMYILIQQRS